MELKNGNVAHVLAFRGAERALTHIVRLMEFFTLRTNKFSKKNFFQRYLFFNEKIFDFMLKSRFSASLIFSKRNLPFKSGGVKLKNFLTFLT